MEESIEAKALVGSGGDNTGGPEEALTELVVILVVSVAVVDTDGSVVNNERSSELMIEAGGLPARLVWSVLSSDRRGNLIYSEAIESLLSLEGFLKGGGIEMLPFTEVDKTISV